MSRGQIHKTHENLAPWREEEHGQYLGTYGKVYSGPTKGYLNPQLLVWLMGFPDGWLEPEPPETPSSRSAPTKSDSGSEN